MGKREEEEDATKEEADAAAEEDVNREDAVHFLRQGNPPAKIAEILGVDRVTAMAYLNQKIGEGELSRYELVLSMNREDRETIDRLWERFLVQKAYKDVDEFIDDLSKSCKKLDVLDAFLYLHLRHAALADMYELIRGLEMNLHFLVKGALIREYGVEREAWWRKGVPLTIRRELVSRREADDDPAPAYNYTTLIHLKEIFKAEWRVLCQVLPRSARADRKSFLSRLDDLNRIRNSVMHPVKRIPLKDEDFAFVRSFADSLGIGLKRGGLARLPTRSGARGVGGVGGAGASSSRPN